MRTASCLLLLTLAGTARAELQPVGPVYRCPGEPVVYSDQLTPQAAAKLGCTSLSGEPADTRPRAASRKSMNAREKAEALQLQRRLRQVLEDRLNDAPSARWREQFLSRSDDPESKLVALCGQVNAKNQIGGYTGFQPYIVTAEPYVMTPNSTAAGGWTAVWRTWCSDPL